MTRDERQIEAAREVLGEELVPRPNVQFQKALRLRSAFREKLEELEVPEQVSRRLTDMVDRKVELVRPAPEPKVPEWADVLGLSEEEAREIVTAPAKPVYEPIVVPR